MQPDLTCKTQPTRVARAFEGRPWIRWASLLCVGWSLIACAPNLTDTPKTSDAGSGDAGHRDGGSAPTGGQPPDGGQAPDGGAPLDAGVGGGGAANDAGDGPMSSDGGASAAVDAGAPGAVSDASALGDVGSGDHEDGGSADGGELCPARTCDRACANGFAVDENGCSLCACAPENAQTDGGSCAPVLCDLYCEAGFRQDSNGCEICDCRESPCDAAICPDNTHCEVRSASSTEPSVAVCMEDENPVCDLPCDPGYHCELQQVVCIRAPCPPLDVCVADGAPDEPLPVDCRELMCPPQTRCGTTASGTLGCVPQLGCESILCVDNMRCRLTPSEDGSGDVPICAVDPNATCDLTCDEGHRCEILETVCDNRVCPPEDRCIPDLPELTCDNILCLEGHDCEMQERDGGQVAPLCVPIVDVCEQVECALGWTCEEERVEDGQRVGRCVQAPPRPACDLECPADQICQLRQAPCPETTCPVVPECVPRFPLSPFPGGCETVRCAAGHRCVEGPLRDGLPTSFCVSIYADYCLNDGDCREVQCHEDDLCLRPPSSSAGGVSAEVCYGLCLGETTFCQAAADCGADMACDLEACVPSHCEGDVCTRDCRAICVQKDQVDCNQNRYDCGTRPAE